MRNSSPANVQNYPLVGVSSCWPMGTNAHIRITSTSKNCVFNHVFTLLPCIYHDSTLQYTKKMLSYLHLKKANCVPVKGCRCQSCYVVNALWWRQRLQPCHPNSIIYYSRKSQTLHKKKSTNHKSKKNHANLKLLKMLV